jgi:hypothetical protein
MLMLADLASSFGQKFATIDDAGRATGFYATGIHSVIPPQAFPISDEVWLAWVEAGQNKIWRDGELVDAPPPVPPPAPPRTCTPREFRLRFTTEERGALTVAASKALGAGDPSLQVFLDDLGASTVVEIDHPDLHAGMNAIVAAGLVTRERADAILAA